MTPLDCALAYCEAGWSVIPCRVTGKRSLVRWRPWQQMAPDPDQLRIWWGRWPKANLAVVTGRLSGVVVVDVDPRHRGDRALAELEREHGDLPWTAVVESPSGGHHVYLAHPGGRIANSASRIGLGVDVRGDGGIALLPPSRRMDGEYRWAVGGPATVPEMPAAWARLLRPSPRRPVAGPGRPLGAAQPPDGSRQNAARLAGVLRTLEQAPEGNRNAVLYWAGCRLAEMLAQGAPASWAEALVQAGVAAGLELSECRDTVASALGRVEP
jgi:Bifunctional DNA primase/polymerase, N-terminal